MDNIESFREYLLGHFPTLKLPKGKKYVEFPIYKGILVCCMVKTNGVNVYLYSGGRVPAQEVFDKLNSLGVSGKVLNDKYTITPMPGSRNPNVVRIDLLIPYAGRDLENDDLRKDVSDLYTQLIDLCMPLNPDAIFHKTPYDKSTKTEIDETDEENSNLLNSFWSLKRNIGDEYRISFLKDGKFKLFETQKDGIKIPLNEATKVDENNTWSLNDNDILISLNNGFVKYNGKLNSEGNKMEGTFANEPGTNKGNWQADSLDNLHSSSKNELQIVVEGKFHFYKYGSLNDEHKTSLEKVLQYVEGCNGVESLIEKLWYGNTKEIFSEVPEEKKDPIIKKLESKGMGGVWEEFNVFYTTPVIDEDNKITILVDNKPFFEGDVKDLGNHLGTGFNLETAIEMFNSDIDLKGSDLVKKVYQKLNNTFSMPYNWCEDLDEYVENHEDFKEALIDQEIKLTKNGWKFNNYTIINKKFKEKASEIEFSERLSVLEYGKFKIKTDPIDVNTFDSLGLMWWIDHDIMDMGGFNNPTRHVYDNEYKEDKIYSYKFSKVFYSDEKNGISELDFTIHDIDIMDITCQLSWPFDD